MTAPGWPWRVSTATGPRMSGTSHGWQRRAASGSSPSPIRGRPRTCRASGCSAVLDELLAATEVDVAIISTPIQTHVPLAELAMRAGADVLLEKPPTASLAEFEQLSAVVAETGRSLSGRLPGTGLARPRCGWRR